MSCCGSPIGARGVLFLGSAGPILSVTPAILVVFLTFFAAGPVCPCIFCFLPYGSRDVLYGLSVILGLDSCFGVLE